MTLTPEYNDDDPVEKEIVDACNALAKLLIGKRRDYGQGNIARHGELGIIVRADDKLARLQNLLKAHTVNHESIEDTWQDLAGYGIIGLLFKKGKW